MFSCNLFHGNIFFHAFAVEKEVDRVLYIPNTYNMLAPILMAIPLQLYAYYVAVARGCDVDKPRNLAKSVTVE